MSFKKVNARQETEQMKRDNPEFSVAYEKIEAEYKLSEKSIQKNEVVDQKYIWTKDKKALIKR